MLEGWRVDRRVFMAFRSADFAVLRVGEACIADEEFDVEGGAMLCRNMRMTQLWPQTDSRRLCYILEIKCQNMQVSNVGWNYGCVILG
jgi:hypothetical protein